MKDHVKKVVMLRRIWGISTSTVCLLLAISIPAPALAAEPEPIDEIVERGLMDDRPQAPMPQEESATSAGLVGVVPVAIVPRSESTLQHAAEA